MHGPSFPWADLPTEMKLAVVDNLDVDAARALSRINRASYQACLPAVFRTVNIPSQKALQRYLDDVPRAYCRYIHVLELSTQSEQWDIRTRSEAVLALLLASPCVESLTLDVHAPLDKSVIPAFAFMSDLTSLTVTNMEDDSISPLSERLVVSICVATPNLTHLSLENITRSSLHAPDVLTSLQLPPVPVVSNDTDIPDHPLLGQALNLPSLLRIPTLRSLSIRDTHLGDPQWGSVEVGCALESLDLGSCIHVEESENGMFAERIVAACAAVPTPSSSPSSSGSAESSTSSSSLDELIPSTPLTHSTYPFQCPIKTPLKRLRSLTLPPTFPVDEMVGTMETLAGSPIESVQVHCYEDEIVETCGALEEFLARRVERSNTSSSLSSTSSRSDETSSSEDDTPPTPQTQNTFYPSLKSLSLSISSDPCSLPSTPEEQTEQKEATRRLIEFCADLRLQSLVGVQGAGDAGVPGKGVGINRRARASSVDAIVGGGGYQWSSLVGCGI